MPYMRDASGRRLDSFTVRDAADRRSSLLPAPLTAGGMLNSGLNPSGTLTTGTSQRTYLAAISGADLQFVFFGWYIGGAGIQTDLPNAVPLKLSVQINGSWVLVTFGGLVNGTLNPGQILVSDPIGMDVTPGTLVVTRTYYNVTTGQRIPQTHLSDVTAPANGDGQVTGSDLTTSGTISPGYVRLFCPNQMVGIPAVGSRVAGVIGDSIATGVGEAGNVVYVNNVAQPGYVLRGLAAGGAAGTRVSVSSEKITDYLNVRARREIALSGCNNVIVEYGRNDANAVQIGTLQANALQLWTGQALRGRRVFQTTITPQTNSTDGFITAGSQTTQIPANEAVRTAFNDWIRAGAPIDPTSKAAVAIGTAGALVAGQAGHPLYGWCPIADAVETARNSGIWKPALRTVTDVAITASQKILTSATANFTSADVGRQVAVIGAGASGAVLTQMIQSVTNATTVSLNDVAGTTVTGATAGIGVYTVDGTHPSPNAHATMGAAIDVSKLATT